MKLDAEKIAAYVWDKPGFVNSLMLLLLGFIFLGYGLYGVSRGKVWNGYYGWIYKIKNPISYWGEVLCFFLGSILFIVYFVYFILSR